MRLAICVLLLALLPGPGPYRHHDVTLPSIELTWTPPKPVQGSIVRLNVRPDTLDPGSDVIAVKGVMVGGEGLGQSPAG